MSYSPYYAPYFRPMNYYNSSIPQEQGTQQMPNQQPQPQQPQQVSIPNYQPSAMPTTNDLIWVLNETEAVSYPVAFGNSVTLWDKNEDTVYIKSVNAQGVPSMRILDYTERTPENASKKSDKQECQCGKEFVRLKDFEVLQGKFDALSEKVEQLTAIPATVKAKAKIKEDAE